MNVRYDDFVLRRRFSVSNHAVIVGYVLCEEEHQHCAQLACVVRVLHGEEYGEVMLEWGSILSTNAEQTRSLRNSQRVCSALSQRRPTKGTRFC